LRSTDSVSGTFGYEGLTDLQVQLSRQAHGENRVDRQKSGLPEILADLAKDPMLLLLIVACSIYFLTGDTGDAIFMLFAIALTTSISLYQDHRSRKALKALETLNLPECRVIRNGRITSIPIAEIVIGDTLLAEEGSSVAADGKILHSNDFTVNESILTGESLAVAKAQADKNNNVYQGTTVVSGLAICEVIAIGANTELGKIGKSLETIHHEETPLQKQIRTFVSKMALIGIIFFAAVWGINFLKSGHLLDSLLKALSLAMSILPEEIPVAFTTFMAIGAWRLSKLGVIVKHTSTIETLGSATVICVDKTGTITKNRMELSSVYSFNGDVSVEPSENSPEGNQVITMAMWASEPIPFDPIEVALHSAYIQRTNRDERNTFKMIHEYPLGGRPPMMTHIFEDGNRNRIIAAKGAPEGIMAICKMSAIDVNKLKQLIDKLSGKGARILGVATGHFEGNDFPKDQHEIPFRFTGLVAFYDPPKDNIEQVMRSFYDAGIKVKMITGDHPQTASAIAEQINFDERKAVLTGDELMQMDDRQLQGTVQKIGIFARMFPEAKLRILNALKANGEIVAMTGDGVNDGPALKAAHIGIAMGKRGTAIAKEVSSLVLSDDDLEKMVSAIASGRKIYSNLKKAIQYIISIHIPIILTVFVPLVLGWVYPSIFTPVHVIFLEMIMGPTCSIVYENEPIERSLMTTKPRAFTKTFFSARELILSVIQGLAISIGVIFIYQYSVHHQFDEQLTRAMVFATIIWSNIFLTLENRSVTKPAWISVGYTNVLIPVIVLMTLIFSAAILYVKPIAGFFEVYPPSPSQVLLCGAVGLLSVVWIELLKLVKYRIHKS
jgi:Ca2+-transporting ATPase